MYKWTQQFVNLIKKLPEVQRNTGFDFSKLELMRELITENIKPLYNLLEFLKIKEKELNWIREAK